MKKCISLFLCLLMLTAVLGVASAEQVDIYMFISQPEFADGINTLIEEYKTVAPDVNIIYETTQNDYPTLLKAKLNSGDVPDIFTSTSGKEIDLYQEYSLDLSDQPLMDFILPEVADVMMASDGTGPYAFAIKSNYFGLIYNKDIFDEVGITEFPKTLSGLAEACEKIAAAGYQPFTSGFAEWWTFKHIFMPFMDKESDNKPAPLIAQFEAGETTLAEHPVLYDNFFTYLDLVAQYSGDKNLETDLSAQISAFATGQAAMISAQGIWVEQDIQAVNPDVNIGFAGYPVSEDPADSLIVAGADQAMRVSNSSEHQQEVLDFVNWWQTSDYGVAWYTDVIKVVSPVKTDKVAESPIGIRAVELIDESGSGALSISYSTDSFHTAFGETLQAYIAGTMTKDEACATIEEKWVELDGAE